MRAKAWVIAIFALAMIVGVGGTSASGAAGPVPHLEVHGKVAWVHVDRYTEVATLLWESTMHISAQDTCPPQTSELPDCVDRMFISFAGVRPPERGDGYYVQVTSYPDAPNVMALEGYGIMFVDGGEPGTVPAGPPFPGDAGITPTRDYGQFYYTPSASEVRVYFLTGGVQIIGGD